MRRYRARMCGPAKNLQEDERGDHCNDDAHPRHGEEPIAVAAGLGANSGASSFFAFVPKLMAR